MCSSCVVSFVNMLWVNSVSVDTLFFCHKTLQRNFFEIYLVLFNKYILQIDLWGTVIRESYQNEFIMYRGLIRKPFSQAVRRALVSNIPTVGKSVSPIIRPFHRTALRYNTSVGNGNNTAQIKVDKPEMMIAFTCKKCDTRSSHIMSKQAYTSGTVLITCPSCKNRHLIADHLKVSVFQNVQNV